MTDLYITICEHAYEHPGFIEIGKFLNGWATISLPRRNVLHRKAQCLSAILWIFVGKSDCSIKRHTLLCLHSRLLIIVWLYYIINVICLLCTIYCNAAESTAYGIKHRMRLVDDRVYLAGTWSEEIVFWLSFVETSFVLPCHVLKINNNKILNQNSVLW